MSHTVNVQQGIINGQEGKTYYGKKYYSFEGIPYAKPPVGKLRFRNPEEPEPWRGIRDTTKPGNKCAQLNPYSNTSIQGSEDCLYLNVYTPNLPKDKIKKLPIILFIHGGRLIFGFGDYYKPDYLIRHDVILVTINYRLNVLGFLCLHTPEAPGNMGLKDTVMALKWVRKNIAAFNGDPENVTVCGESAGGAIATSLLTSKMAAGLYSKIIAQSACSISDLFIVEDDPIEKARALALNLGKDLKDEKSLWEFLIDVPLDDLIYAFSALELSRPASVLNPYFMPVVEKKLQGVERFFEEYPIVSIKENRFEKVPILTGTNAYEAGLFVQIDNEGKITFESDFNYFVPRFVFFKRDSEEVKNFANKLRGFYLNNKPIGDDTKVEYLKMISDVYFERDIMYFVETVSKFNSDLYVYKFNYMGNMNTRVMRNIGVKGTTHGDMVQYQFYRKNKADKCTDRDNKIVDFLSEAWCNFAKTGKPTWTDQTTEWLAYSKSGRYGLVIEDELKLTKDLHTDRLEFWLNLTGERSKL